MHDHAKGCRVQRFFLGLFIRVINVKDFQVREDVWHLELWLHALHETLQTLTPSCFPRTVSHKVGAQGTPQLLCLGLPLTIDGP